MPHLGTNRDQSPSAVLSDPKAARSGPGACGWIAPWGDHRPTRRNGDAARPCRKKTEQVTEHRLKITVLMRETGMRLTKMDGARGRGALRAGCSGLVLFLYLLLLVAPARGAEAPTATPPAMDNMMSSQGWLQQIVI